MGRVTKYAAGLLLGITGLFAATSCGFDVPYLGTGPDGAPPPGSDAGADTDAGLACDPDGSEDTCNGTNAIRVCRSDGSGFEVVTCLLGCDPGPPSRCRDVVPSNSIPTSALDGGDADLDTGAIGSLFLYSDTGLITDEMGMLFRSPGEGYDAASGVAFRYVDQGLGLPSIGVFSMASLHVAGGTRIRGIGMNSLAILASGAIVVDGAIDVTGGGNGCDPLWAFEPAQCPAPGASPGGNAQSMAPGSGGGSGGEGGGLLEAKTGGGGGGHLGAGGDGGDSALGGGGAAGAPFGAGDASPLTGGGGGGGGGSDNGCGAGGAGGGGGGSLQLVSRTRIEIGALPGAACGVNAGGGGGGGGACDTGGGGGGAGGAILLEAPEVTANAGCTLAANGGGGGGGSSGDTGVTGLLSTSAAGGGAEGCGFCGASAGASGGSLSSPNGGSPGWSGGPGGGGGGGGVGTVYIRTLNGTGFTGGVAASPALGEGPISVQ